MIVMNEDWKSVPGYEGLYEASSLGHVRSLRRAGARYFIKLDQPFLVKPKLNKRIGYYHIDLSCDGVKTRFRLNRLICLTFHGPPPFEGAEAAHLDGHASNNSASNLEWVTSKVNHSHRELHGTMKRGDGHISSLLTEDSVREMRRSYDGRRGGIKKLAEKYNVHPYTITQALFGKNWKGVLDPPPLYRPLQSQYRREQCRN